MEVVYANTVKRQAADNKVIHSVGTALINGYSARCLLRVGKLEAGALERHSLRRGQIIPAYCRR